jgi:hypothetical protein
VNTEVPEEEGPAGAEALPALDITALAIGAARGEPTAEPVPESDPDLPDQPMIPALRPRSPLQMLVEEPHRFDFDQAVAVAAHGRDPLRLRYRTAARLGYPWGEVLAARPEHDELVLGTSA